MKNLKIVTVVLALVSVLSVGASASTIERTVTPDNHIVDSFNMMCRVVEVQKEPNRYIIICEDNAGNNWEFYNDEDYWKVGDKMTCVFDYCETCETLELNGIVE